MKKLWITVLLIISSQLTIAQDYLVTTKGDTVYGKVNVLRDQSKREYLVLKPKDGKKERFLITKVRGFQMKGEAFHTLNIFSRYHFAKLVKEGYLNHYKYTPEDANYNDSFSQSLLVKKDGGILILPGLIGFRTQVSKFLDDCDSVEKKVKDKVYKKSDLDQIIEEYNVCIETHSQARFSPSSPNTITKTTPITPALTKINDLKTLLKYSEIQEKEEVIEMIKDLETKIQNNEKIPTYLSNALKEAIKTDEKLSKILEEILQAQ